MSDSVPPIELPACELGRLEEISELVSSLLLAILFLWKCTDFLISTNLYYSLQPRYIYRLVAVCHHQFAEKN